MAGFNWCGGSATVHTAPSCGRDSGFSAESTHVLQPPRPTSLSDQAETARQIEASYSRDRRIRCRMTDENG